jgi:hypothetical protein
MKYNRNTWKYCEMSRDIFLFISMVFLHISKKNNL